MELAPICIFAYNRPDHLKQVVDSLQLNPESSESTLYIFVDGARKAYDVPKLKEISKYIHKISGFKEVIITERDKNLGLAASIITGVSFVLNKHEAVIVLEDDLVTSPHFLKFMNSCLELYKNENNVASIHGYVYPVKTKLPETFFLQGADCWGWATWKRAWSFFEADGVKLLSALHEKNLTAKFNFDNSYPYIQMLEDQINGKNNSWAIRWNASAFVNNMYTLYPGFSLVENIGHDDSGENCQVSDDFKVNLNNQSINPSKIKVEGSEIGYNAFKKYFKSLRSNPITRVLNYIRRRL